ncbi:hypothetical protein [Geodermatophilus sabuli]|uniref:Uncharacterized protein n=1 Tax=Geodermatophilus sabuli TaxID=1564158 RepID=A0A285E9F2_9ACTN|nr:hypothetical protein [Geodermatophilus sabuli]MBB3084843.1 hypothetical protein [Geodermatophilus sabuli]SNX95749.1 hypothetical protein SAMN06893097_102453 [Geodermatophilus sabuli]
MTERDQSPAGTQRGADDWREQTTPGLQPVGGARPDAGYGGYAGGAPPTAVPPGQPPASSTAPQYSTKPVTVRRPDALAGLLLVLAGVAAGVSLLLRWLSTSELTGLDLVRRGVEGLGRDVAGVFADGMWQPVAVVGGGAVLLVLGILVLLPARSHRFLGVLALLVSLVAFAGVLVPLADAGWERATFDTGFWFAVAVPALGLLGALKAMVTSPRR